MPSITLNNQAKFPAGTSVAAYPESNWGASQLPVKGAPQGAATETATVAAGGNFTYTTLAFGVVYYAYALVGGEHRYMQFQMPVSRDVNADVATITGAVNAASVAATGAVTGGSVNAGSVNAGATTLGLFGKAPVAQQPANPDTAAATLAALETEVNEIKATLRAYGLIAT